MSAWPGKNVIGLTGNIATGKSTVRKMLEHLGAQCIDADILSKRAIAKGSPGYQMVLDKFGHWLLDVEGHINRERLGQLVFSEPAALRQLEEIVHPLVFEAINSVIQRSSQADIVIEAIKLIESGLADNCDSIWVTTSTPELQLERLTNLRGMNEAQARQRIKFQAAAEEKMTRADLVIHNSSSLANVWNQVLDAWQKRQPEILAKDAPIEPPAMTDGKPIIKWAASQDAVLIAGLLNQLGKSNSDGLQDDGRASFGDKAYLLFRNGSQVFGLVGWKIDHSIARIDDIYIDSKFNYDDVLGPLLGEVERISCKLNGEVLLAYLPDQLHSKEYIFKSLGYKTSTIQELGAQGLQEAMEESIHANSILLFKRLKIDKNLNHASKKKV
jgi:dephospho-CoA kinase